MEKHFAKTNPKPTRVDDSSVISELTQETKNTMPLLSPMTPLSKDKEALNSQNMLQNGRQPLAAAPMLSESDADSYMHSPGKTASSRSRTSVSVSLVSTGSLMHLNAPGVASTPQAVAAAANYREGSNSTANSSLKQAAMASASSQQHNGFQHHQFGMRNPSHPIIESSDDDDHNPHHPNDRDEESQNSSEEEATIEGDNDDEEEDGYGTEDESVVSARSLQRRQSLQHKRNSVSSMNQSALSIGPGSTVGSDQTPIRGGAGGSGSRNGGFPRPASQQQHDYYETNNNPPVASYVPKHSGGGFLGADADSMRSRESFNNRAHPPQVMQQPQPPPQAMHQPPAQQGMHQQQPPHMMHQQPPPQMTHQPQPPQMMHQQTPPPQGESRPKRRAGRRRYKDDAPPPERGVTRVNTGDSTHLVRVPTRRHQQQGPPPPPTPPPEYQQQHAVPMPPSRGLVRTGTGDSTDLAAMRGAPRRARRRPSAKAPLSELQPQQPQPQQHHVPPPPSRGLQRMGTGDSTDLAAMRGAPRRARRRESAKTQAQPAPLHPNHEAVASAPPQRPQRRQSTNMAMPEPTPESLVAPESPQKPPPPRGPYKVPPPESPSMADSSYAQKQVSPHRRGSTAGRFFTPDLGGGNDDEQQPQQQGPEPVRVVARTQTANSMDLKSSGLRRGSRRPGNNNNNEAAGNDEPRRGVVRTYTANSMDLNQQAQAGGGSGLPRKEKDVYGREIRRGKRRGGKRSTKEEPLSPQKLPTTMGVPPSPQKGDAALDYLPHAMKQQRRASTGAVPYKSMLGPDKAADEGEDEEDPIATGSTPQPTMSPKPHGILRVQRRASTGHMSNQDLVATTHQYKFQNIAEKCPPTPPNPSSKMGRRRSTGGSFGMGEVHQELQPPLETQLEVPVAVVGGAVDISPEEDNDDDDKSLTEDESMDSIETETNTDDEDDGEEEGDYDNDDLEDDAEADMYRQEEEEEPALNVAVPPTPPGNEPASPAKKTKAMLAAERMGGGRASAETEVEEAESLSHNDNNTLEVAEYDNGEVSESENSINSAKNTRRRNSIQSSLNQDPLASSLLVSAPTNASMKRNMLVDDELGVEQMDQMDCVPGYEADEKYQTYQSTAPITENTADDGSQFLSGRSLGVDQPQNVSPSPRPTDPLKNKDSWGSRAAPFTTPHTTLTKDALAKSNQAAGIPLENTLKVSMHGNTGNWGDLKIQSSCDSSEGRTGEFGENLYRDSPTMDEFDKYKQRPRRQDSIKDTFVNMEEILAKKSGSKDSKGADKNCSQDQRIPDFIPAATVTNASDFIVRCFVARLRNGIAVVKHNRSRWSRSSSRNMFLLPDGKTLSWKPTDEEEDKGKRPRLDLTKCKEVRHAWTRDPETRRQCGTGVLRKKVKDENSAGRSFSLIFAKRTLDITALTPDSCKVLMEGFSALCFRLQLEKLRDNPENEAALDDKASGGFLSDDGDWASTVYGETTASLTQSTPFSNGNPPTWGL